MISPKNDITWHEITDVLFILWSNQIQSYLFHDKQFLSKPLATKTVFGFILLVYFYGDVKLSTIHTNNSMDGSTDLHVLY